MRQVCKCFSPGRGETRLWQISTPLSLDCCSILQRSMQRKTESTFLIRHQLFGFAMATVIITIKAQIYFDTSFFSPCALITQGLVCVFGGALCIKEVSVFAQCTPDWWLYCSSQSDLCGLTEKWKSWVFFHCLFPHSSTFLKVLLWEGGKKASRRNEKEKLTIKTEGTMHYLLLWLQFCAFPFLTRGVTQ